MVRFHLEERGGTVQHWLPYGMYFQGRAVIVTLTVTVTVIFTRTGTLAVFDTAAVIVLPSSTTLSSSCDLSDFSSVTSILHVP